MNYITPDTIAEIKQIDLLTYLRHYEPHELVRITNNMYSTKTHDSIRISNGLWNRFSTGEGGKTALDYLIKVKNMTFIEAANVLLEKDQATVSRPAPVTKPTKIEKKLLLPEKAETTESATRYLISRGIDKSIITDFIRSNNIFESHVFSEVHNMTYKNIVFIGHDQSGIPRYASIRGIDTDYKGEASGSDKHFSFRSLQQEVSSNKVHIFESAIDLLSCATHLKMTGCNYRDYNLLSLAGIYMPQKKISESKVPVALEKYLNENSHIKSIVLHLDNDNAGKRTSNALQEIIKTDYEVLNYPPKHGKDYNDYLIRMLKTVRSQER